MSRKTRTQQFVDAVLALPTADNCRTMYLQLLLILLWHELVFWASAMAVNWWHQGFRLGLHGISGGEWWSFEWGLKCVYKLGLGPFLGKALLPLIPLEGLIGWLLFRIANNRLKPQIAFFIRTWWRTCVWGTFVVPILNFTWAFLFSQHDTAMIGMLLGMSFLVLCPIVLAKSDRTRSRRSNWKPQCPECGYSVRGLPTPRCPECGIDFPSKNIVFRRWAVMRFPWDRLRRHSIISAHIRSVAFLIFTPAKAARSIALPDRWNRCGKWAIAHILLAAVFATLLGHNELHMRGIARCIETMMNASFSSVCETRLGYAYLDIYDTLPLVEICSWIAHSLLAWALPLILSVTIACTISFCFPGRHRAAKLGGVKWSLYLTPLFLITLGILFGFDCITRQQPTPGTTMPLWPIIVPYGTWWAIGIASNQYNRTRNWAVTVGFASIFLGTWFLTTHFLFSPGALETLP